MPIDSPKNTLDKIVTKKGAVKNKEVQIAKERFAKPT